MKVTFLGAAQTVTGSCYLVETEQTSFLIDCGLHQGQPHEELLNEQPFPFPINKIDFLLLSHAHIDHSGRLPKLYADGYSQPIYATKATCDLCAIMLPDSGHIQESEYNWRVRKGNRAGRQIVAPLYTMQNALDSLRLFKPIRYDQTFNPAEDVRVRFRDAGHILGSSILEIWVAENGGETKLVFSGDLGNKDVPIMRDPTVIDGADFLLLESTYGDRLHDNKAGKIDRFAQIIDETIQRGGNVIIPSFAVGRTQELIYALNQEHEKYSNRYSNILKTPVYIDSPLAISATEVFRKNTDCFDAEARAYIENGDNPLDFENLHFVRTSDESKMLNEDPDSKIIISASGMCDAGRIRHHLKHNLWRKDSAVVFVGYQARGTLGRALVDGAKTVRIFGEEIAVKARIEMIDSFSGHADRDGLLEWVAAMTKKPQKILLVHGEPTVISSFQHTLRQQFGISAVAAQYNQTIDLGVPVQRASVLIPLTQVAQVTEAVGMLDAIEAEFAALIEKTKLDITTVSPSVRYQLLASLKEQLVQSTTAIVQRHAPQ
ncbi:MAG: MBL fold metallo-hydrolase [Eubacteriales bacterium]|nr:MBL fold metallo-hydrolase [Eubacteriales bacterium]